MANPVMTIEWTPRGIQTVWFQSSFFPQISLVLQQPVRIEMSASQVSPAYGNPDHSFMIPWSC